VPIPSFLFYFFFGKRKVLVGKCFIVSERRQFMREKFSPLSCTPHMIDNLPTECFIFLDRVRGVEDTVIHIMHIYTPKAVV
jgi:hypothetical protein